ncbi:MAG: flagellar export chaperone FliS [Candidatus Hydrogenedentes bacterium]|nr:flagellar export chaperone FliS [Candidatus Hydrogenedentota bacterium]
MTASASRLNAYTKVNVETASQGKLVVMLFNGAIKRAEEAKRQLSRGKAETVHNNLIRAQDIIAELRSALDMKAHPVALDLDRLYEYFQHLLIQANVKKNAAPIDECVRLMTEMRDTWEEAFASISKTEEIPAIQPINQHGAAVLNIQS